MTPNKPVANKPKTTNGKPPHRWQKGQSGNPRGRPKDGESWSAIITTMGNMYPEDIVQFVGKDNPLGKEIAKFPKAVQMKYLVVARVFSALMFEPSSGLLKEILDRLEGKVTEHVDMTTKGEQVSNLSDEQKILRVFELLKKVNDARP